MEDASAQARQQRFAATRKRLDPPALRALDALEPSVADELLQKLEGLGAKVMNANGYVMAAARELDPQGVLESVNAPIAETDGLEGLGLQQLLKIAELRGVHVSPLQRGDAALIVLVRVEALAQYGASRCRFLGARRGSARRVHLVHL